MTTQGLGAVLGWCRHGSKDPQTPPKLVPLVRSEEEALELRERKLDRAALLRALEKGHTEEGRKTLTSREARMLAAYEAEHGGPQTS